MMNRTSIFSVIVLAIILTIPSAYCNPIYSSNGIGLVIPDNYGRSRGMGGSGIADGDGMNVLRGNPALLGSFQKHSLSVGLSHDRNTAYIGESDQPDYAKTNPDMFKLVLPIAKGFVFGWGLSPYSRTDSVIDVSPDDYKEVVTFTGGINVSSVGLAGSYKDFLKFGLALNYNFGTITEEWEQTFPDNDDLFESTSYIYRKYKGYSTTVGFLARVFDNTYFGGSYTGKSDLDLSVNIRPGDYYNPERLYDKKTVSLPATWRMGITSSFAKSMTASMDVSFLEWENAANTSKQKEMYNDTYSVGAGVRLNPSKSLQAPFYRKLPVSAGFKFGTMYYKSGIEGEKAKPVFEKAVTMGIEFPFQEDIASLITSFELGTRGDKDKNGWEETYIGIGILLIGTIK